MLDTAMGKAENFEVLAEAIREWKNNTRLTFRSWVVSSGIQRMVVALVYSAGSDKMEVTVNSRTVLQCENENDAAKVCQEISLGDEAYLVRNITPHVSNDGIKPNHLRFGTNCKEDAIRVANFLSSIEPYKVFTVEHFRRTVSKSVLGGSEEFSESAFYL